MGARHKETKFLTFWVTRYVYSLADVDEELMWFAMKNRMFPMFTYHIEFWESLSHNDNREEPFIYAENVQVDFTSSRSYIMKTRNVHIENKGLHGIVRL